MYILITNNWWTTTFLNYITWKFIIKLKFHATFLNLLVIIITFFFLYVRFTYISYTIRKKETDIIHKLQVCIHIHFKIGVIKYITIYWSIRMRYTFIHFLIFGNGKKWFSADRLQTVKCTSCILKTIFLKK